MYRDRGERRGRGIGERGGGREERESKWERMRERGERRGRRRGSGERGEG